MLVILSITPRGDGTAVAVVSLSPGERAQLVINATGLDPAAQRASVTAIAHRIDRRATQ